MQTYAYGFPRLGKKGSIRNSSKVSGLEKFRKRKFGKAFII